MRKSVIVGSKLYRRESKRLSALIDRRRLVRELLKVKGVRYSAPGIIFAFSWSASPQGHTFWMTLDDGAGRTCA